MRGARIVGRGVLFAIVALVCFAILTIGLAGPIRSAGWLPVLLASRTANAATVWVVLAVVLARAARRRRRSWSPAPAPTVARRTAVAVAIVGGLLDIAGFVAFAIGLEQAPTWIVGLASSFGPVVTVLVAVLVWGERLRPNQWLGLVGIAVGPRGGRAALSARRQPGRLNQNRVWPPADSAPTRPPPASTSCFTIARPMPAPPRARSRDFSTR